MPMKTRYTVIDGEIVAEKRGGVRSQYVPDPLGSTVALLDNTQTKTDTFAYWPYGEEATRTGTTATPFRYVGTMGYYRDSATRNYVRARYLENAQGRWMTEDPIGLISDFNLYIYCRNNPINSQDQTGLQPENCCNEPYKTHITNALNEACARMQKMPKTPLSTCIQNLCKDKDYKIACKDTPGAQSYLHDCATNNAMTLGGKPNYIITLLCPLAFDEPAATPLNKKRPCLGQTLIHEMVHACGNLGMPQGGKPEPYAEGYADVVYPPSLKKCVKRALPKRK